MAWLLSAVADSRIRAGALLAPHPDSDEKLQRDSLGYYEKISRQDPAAGIKVSIWPYSPYRHSN